MCNEIKFAVLRERERERERESYLAHPLQLPIGGKIIFCNSHKKKI